MFGSVLKLLSFRDLPYCHTVNLGALPCKPRSRSWNAVFSFHCSYPQVSMNILVSRNSSRKMVFTSLLLTNLKHIQLLENIISSRIPAIGEFDRRPIGGYEEDAE